MYGCKSNYKRMKHFYFSILMTYIVGCTSVPIFWCKFTLAEIFYHRHI